MGKQIHFLVTTETGEITEIVVDPNETVENLKALIEVQTGILLNEQLLFLEGTELRDGQASLQSCGIKDDTLLLVTRKRVAAAPAQSRQQNQQQKLDADAEAFAQQARSDPALLQRILDGNPPLAEAILANDLPVIRKTLEEINANRRAQETERIRRLQAFEADPFNPEAQKALEEEIRQQNVDNNMEIAMEHAPEAFGSVIMLYIDCAVNSVPVKAFVDTGAQMTIMNVKCAERCGIMRLLDRRYNGVAKGVGTAKIIGRVHLAPIQIGKSFFPCSFTILEGQDMDFILGLDMLRRHQCVIDLGNNLLSIGTEKTPFLSEADIPRALEEAGDELSSTHSGPPLTIPPPANTTNQTTAPPASAKPAPRPQTNTPAAATNAPNEQSVQQLMNLGASRQEAENLLRQYRGNVDMAASHLFG